MTRTTISTTRTWRPRAVAAVALAAVLLGSAGAGVAAASPGGTTPATITPGADGSVTITLGPEQVDRWCANAPQRLDRARGLAERLAADAATPGSVAWARERADRAQSRDRADLADRLRARADRLETVAGALPGRLARLQERTDLLCGTGS